MAQPRSEGSALASIVSESIVSATQPVEENPFGRLFAFPLSSLYNAVSPKSYLEKNCDAARPAPGAISALDEAYLYHRLIRLRKDDPEQAPLLTIEFAEYRDRCHQLAAGLAALTALGVAGKGAYSYLNRLAVGDRGNYSAVREMLWQAADTIIWLDYPLWFIW
ncbi:MAG: hypothetical protein ACYCZF_00455 [Anaerolineae bacterium]